MLFPFDMGYELTMDAECSLCLTQQGRGPLADAVRVYDDEHVTVWHAAEGYLGHLLVVSRRHAPYLDDLTDDEAAAVGRVVARSARGLRRVFDAEFVFSAVIGTGVAHFHQHVVVRHPGTPADLPWHQVDEWQGAPTGDRADVEALARRMRPFLHA